MLLSINNGPFVSITYDKLAEYFNDILMQYDDYYSLQIISRSKDDELISEIQKAHQPADANPNFEALTKKITPKD